MAVSAGLGFDIQDVVSQAAKLDKELEKLVAKSEKFSQNMRSAFNIHETGGAQQALKSFKDLYALMGGLDGKKLTIDTDTSKIKEMSDALNQIAKFVNSYPKGLTPFDTQGIYASNEGILKAKNKLDEIRTEIEKIKEVWRNAQSVINNNESSKKDVAQAKKTQQEAEYLMRIEIEREATAKKNLEYEEMTQDKKAAYIQKKLNEILDAEKRNVAEIQREYKKLWGDLSTFSKSRETIDKASEGKTMSKDQKKQYDTLVKLEQETETKIQQMYSKHQGILSDITLKETAKRSKSIADELKKQAITAKDALKMAKDARTGTDKERAKDAIKQALMNTDEKDVKTIEKLNSAYNKLRASIESLTRAQQNEQTLQPSIRNEYRQVLKSLDDIKAAKDRLAATDAYKNGKGAEGKEAKEAMDALIAREKDLNDRRKELKKDGGKYLEAVERQNAARQAEIRLKAIEETERKAAEIKKKYGAISSKDAETIIKNNRDADNARKSQKAIEELSNAREKLNKKDKNYKTTLDALNKEISRHQSEMAKANSMSAAGALSYSKSAKSLNEMRIAIKNLDEARRNENLSTASGEKNYKKLTKELERQKKEYDKLTGTVRTSTSKISTLVAGIGKKLAAVFGVQQLTKYVTKLIAVRGEFELQQRSLQAILQNKDEADKLWEKTIALAVKSPFKVGDLVKYTKQLAAYRIESDKLYETNKMLADISSGLSVDMSRLILAYGQVRTASYLRGTELRQFTEAGVPLLEELAKRFSELENRMVSVGEVFGMISKRQVYFEDVDAVLRRMTEVGGVFHNMQEIQSETLRGMLLNLKDSVDLMMNEIGQRNEGVTKGAVQAAKYLVDHWKDVLHYITLAGIAFALFKVSSFAVLKLATPILAVFKALIHPVRTVSLLATKLITTFKGWIVNMKNFILGLKEATTRQEILNSTAAKNVYIAALTIALTLLGKYILDLKKAKQAQEELEKISFEGIQQATELSAKFKELANTATDATQGVDKQNEALDEMQRTYKDLVPAHLMTIENLRKMEGNYDSVTRAIYAKIEAQVKEKKIEKVRSEEGEELENASNRLIKRLNKLGISTDAARTIIAKFREEVEKGTIPLFDMEKANSVFEDIIKRYTDLKTLNKGLKINYPFKQMMAYYDALVIFDAKIKEIEEEESVSPWVEKGASKTYKSLSKELEKLTKKRGELQKENIKVRDKALSALDSIGKKMAKSFKGNVDLLNRPIIDAFELAKKGWEDVGEGIATVFSSSYGIEDSKGKVREILVTPILPDGSVLSPQELEDYVNNTLQGAEDFLKADNKGIVIAVDVDESAGEKLHQLQEQYYGIIEKYRTEIGLQMTIQIDEESKKSYIKELESLSENISKRVSLGALDSIGQKMAKSFKGNVDLLNRPIIDATELAKKGWEDIREGIATSLKDHKELIVTPILPDGSVLSPQELEDYVNNTLLGAKNILKEDTKGVVISVNADNDSLEKLRKLYEEYYDLKEEVKDFEGIPISVEDAVAAQSVIAKIADEINSINIDDITRQINEFRLSASILTGVDLGKIRATFKRAEDSYDEYVKKVEDALKSYQDTIKIFDDAEKEGKKIPFLQRFSLLGTKTLTKFKEEAWAISTFLDMIRVKLGEEKKTEGDWLAKQIDEYVKAEGILGIDTEKLLKGEEDVDAFFKRIQSELTKTESLIEQAKNAGQNLFSWGSNEQGIESLKKIRTELRFLLDMFGVAPMNEFNSFLVHSIQDFLASKGDSYSFIDIDKLSKNEQTVDEFFNGLNDDYKKNEEKIKELEIATAQLFEDITNEAKIEELKTTNEALKDTLLTYGKWEEKEKKNSSNSLYDERIKVIDDMSKKFIELNKTLSRSEALAGAFAAYKDAFATAYEDIDWIPKNVRTMTPQQFVSKVLNFPNEDAIVKFLDRLAKEDMKTYEKIKVELAKGGYVLDAKVRIKKESDEEIKKQIQEMFDQYDISLELDKLGLTKDYTSGLFGINYTSLAELRKGVESMREKFIGTDMLKDYEDTLKKISDLEDKATVERMKTYSKYLVAGYSERLKLKLEEMKKLKEIDELEAATAKKQANGQLSDAQKNYFKQMREGVSKEYKKSAEKQQWEDFKNSEMYTMMFDDLEHYGTAALEALKGKIEELKGSLSTLDAPEVKEIITQLNKIDDVMIARKPSAALNNIRAEIKSRGVGSFAEETTALGEAEERERAAQREMEIIQKVQNARAQNIDLTAEDLMAYSALVGVTDDAATAEQNILDTQQQIVDEAQSEQAERRKNLNLLNQEKQAQVAKLNKANEYLESISKGLKAGKELLETITGESDGVGSVIADAGLGMLSLIQSAITMQAEFVTMGIAANSALGIIGWVAIALEAIVLVLKAIFSAKDKKLEKQMEDQLNRVKELQESYDELEKKIDEAYDTHQLEAYSREVQRLTDQMIAAQKKAIDENDKRKQNKTVKERGEELRKELDDLYEQQAESLKDLFSKATDGILDETLDAARSFVDAWYDAFKETGDGLKGLEDNFDEMILNMLKQQAAQSIVGSFVKTWTDDLKNYINPDIGDLTLTAEEVKKWATPIKDSLPELNALLQQFFESFDGVFTNTNGNGLTAMQKGIQGVTEAEAEVIESYLNSLRSYVAMNGEQLREHTKYLKSIWEFFDAIGYASHPSGGFGLRVVI